MALSDTQLMLLSAASQREDLLVTLPAPPRTGAARTSLSKLLSQGLLEEVTVSREQPHWRTDDDGQLIGLRITLAGLEAIGLEPEGEPERDESTSCTPGRSISGSRGTGREPTRSARRVQAGPGHRAAAPRGGSKSRRTCGRHRLAAAHHPSSPDRLAQKGLRPHA